MNDTENMQFQLNELWRSVDDLRDDMNAKHDAVMAELTKANKANEELLSLFNGGKTVLGFVRAAGKVTIAFSVFVAAIGACWLAIKAFLSFIFMMPK